MNNVKELKIRTYTKPILFENNILYPLVKDIKYTSVDQIPMEEILGIVRIKDRVDNEIITDIFLCNNEIDDDDIYNSHNIVMGLLGLYNDKKDYDIFKVLYFVLLEKNSSIINEGNLIKIQIRKLMNTIKNSEIKLCERYFNHTVINNSDLYPLEKNDNRYICVKDIPIDIIKIKERSACNFLTEVFLGNNELDIVFIYEKKLKTR